MDRPNIKTNKSVVPVIYAYTTPEIRRHDGCTKIGDTERNIDERIGEQANTIDNQYKLEWVENAVFAGTMKVFRDYDFHKVLEQDGIERLRGINTGGITEWFRISPADAEKRLQDFRHGRITIKSDNEIIPYVLREEQDAAVNMFIRYKDKYPGSEVLLNAKPRYGKTLVVYDLAKRIKARKILIVTNRPAIGTSWYSDYMKFLGRESGFFFVSSTDGVKDKPLVISYSAYSADAKKRESDKLPEMGMIYFVSLQDIKGSMYFQPDGIDKLQEVSTTQWELLIIDEAHEGVDTYKTDIAFSHIKRDFTIHLSGTPFKALANNKFRNEAIFNWTYADEQRKKMELQDDPDNPYAILPKLNMYTYQMSEIVADKIKYGIEIQGITEEFAFDLGEFFRVRESDSGVLSFIYNEQVDMFLNALTYKEKYPFSTFELREELSHTLWLLDRVDSVYALAKKLNKHEVFKDYKVITAVGDGAQDEGSISGKTYDKVVDTIKKYSKTITLSVRQLTTGVTIPEWSAVLMLSNIQDPSPYMQAVFRVQNPCIFDSGKTDAIGQPIFERKENAYVFDFDPARTLTVFEQFANNLNVNTKNGGGTLEQRQANIRELLNFFPVIGEDDNGSLVELNAEQVLTIPRRIRSVEVVRRGFMSNFLFNIRNVFNIPKEALHIINQFPAVKEMKKKTTTDIVIESSDGFNVSDDGTVIATDSYIDMKVQDVFGAKIYSENTESLNKLILEADTKECVEVFAESLSDMLSNTASSIVEDVKESYGKDIKVSDVKRLNSQLKQTADRTALALVTDYQIQQNIIDKECKEAIEKAVEKLDTTNKSTEEIEKQISDIEKKAEDESYKKKNELKKETTEKIQDMLNKFEEDSKKEATKTVEERKEQKRATDIMEDIRDRLRGFARTIPSFIMAYCDAKDSQNEPVNITLATFDKIIPDEVFKEVTSITLDEFKQLRDGFDYVDDEGIVQHFEGNVFDEVVFDDSVAEFISLKKKLSDYFSEVQTEDIFDYIPPQKTNQIFTPKDVVKDMIDMLEKENPGCFDDPKHTFIDPYMKSGLFITEIVKRLFRSEQMKKLYPDKKERLKHIFGKQVYGLAPTQIIYNIAIAYIFGFANGMDGMVDKSHFIQLDALPYAKEGTLAEKLDELFS